MQYANNGNILSYLNQNINKLTWRMKLQYLKDMAQCLLDIHSGLDWSACGNIVLIANSLLEIKGFNHSSVVLVSRNQERLGHIQQFKAFCLLLQQKSFILTNLLKNQTYTRLVLSYIWWPPLRNRSFDKDLMCDIIGGMPDSAPELYKKLAELCCDADFWQAPNEWMETLGWIEEKVNKNGYSTTSIWDTIYHNDITPLPRLEKECSSKILPTKDLGYSHQLPSIPGFALTNLEIKFRKLWAD